MAAARLARLSPSGEIPETGDSVHEQHCTGAGVRVSDLLDAGDVECSGLPTSRSGAGTAVQQCALPDYRARPGVAYGARRPTRHRIPSSRLRSLAF